MRHFRGFLVALLLVLVSCTPAFASYTATATIPNGGSLSPSVDLTQFLQTGNHHPVAIIMPAAWTTAGITLQASNDNSTFVNVYTQAGTEYTVTSPAASEYIILTPSDLVGMAYLKVRSGTSGSPVTQGAARAVTIVFN